jgi:hypothetical protein
MCHCLKHSNGLQLRAIVYYNSHFGACRGKQLNSLTARFSRLMDECIKAGVNVQTRWTPFQNSSQQLEQLFSCTDFQINRVRRYVCHTIMQTDVTFKTNDLVMPLATHMGVTNTNHTFPFALSFVCSESKGSFQFSFKQISNVIRSINHVKLGFLGECEH